MDRRQPAPRTRPRRMAPVRRWYLADGLGDLRKGEISSVIETAKPEGIKPTASILASVTELTRIKVFVPDERWDADSDILVCNNGALHISTGELAKHQPEHYATSSVPYEYDPNARAVIWDYFLKSTASTAADFL